MPTPNRAKYIIQENIPFNLVTKEECENILKSLTVQLFYSSSRFLNLTYLDPPFYLVKGNYKVSLDLILLFFF